MIAICLLTLSVSPWWTIYGDKQLDALVQQALIANLDIKTATARIAEARALAGESRSKLLPAVNLTSSAGRLRGGFQQDFPLDQGFAHQPEFIVFEITQSAMDQLG